MNWHTHPEHYRAVACTKCLDRAGRPTGRDGNGRPCPVCRGTREVAPDGPAPKPGRSED